MNLKIIKADESVIYIPFIGKGKKRRRKKHNSGRAKRKARGKSHHIKKVRQTPDNGYRS